MDKFVIPNGEWFPKKVYPFANDNGMKWWRWLLCREHTNVKNVYNYEVALYYLREWYDLRHLYAEEYIAYQIKEGYLLRRGKEIHFTQEGKLFIAYCLAGGVDKLNRLKPILRMELYRNLLHYDVPTTEQAYHTYLYDHYNTNENQLYQYQFELFQQQRLTCRPHSKSGIHYKLYISEPYQTEPCRTIN